MGNFVYTVHSIDDGIVLFSGDTSSMDLVPPFDAATHTITWGVEANPETEKIENGKAVPYVFKSQDALLGDIVRERRRRLAAGFDHNFGDARGVHRIGTTEEDEKGWDKVSKLAQAYLNTSNPDGTIDIVTDSGPVTLTALEWQHILIAAGQFQQPIFQKSFELQAMNPIPQDIENEVYWQ